VLVNIQREGRLAKVGRVGEQLDDIEAKAVLNVDVLDRGETGDNGAGICRKGVGPEQFERSRDVVSEKGETRLTHHRVHVATQRTGSEASNATVDVAKERQQARLEGQCLGATEASESVRQHQRLGRGEGYLKHRLQLVGARMSSPMAQAMEWAISSED
jgi:hypothetical protein